MGLTRADKHWGEIAFGMYCRDAHSLREYHQLSDKLDDIPNGYNLLPAIERKAFLAGVEFGKWMSEGDLPDEDRISRNITNSIETRLNFEFEKQ